jgi:hypothetical protein
VADYVLKPAERERLQLTVQRIRSGWPPAACGETAPDAPPRPLQQLLHQLSAR